MNTEFINIALSHRCIQVILGGLLGDGSLRIQNNYRNARYQIRHSIKQEQYIKWKHKELSEIALPKLQIQKADAFSKEEKIALQSKASAELTKIHAIVCKENRLCVQASWLKALNEIALLVWWLDDGSLISGRKQGCLCTDRFSFQDQEILQQYLANVWKIDVRIGRLKGRKQSKQPVYYRLYFNNTELRKLFDIIMPCLEIGTMVKKFALTYNGFDDQERWICTMKEKTPKEMHKHIDLWYLLPLTPSE